MKDWHKPKVKKLYSPMEEKVLSRLANGMTRADISEDIGISRVYLRDIIRRIKNKREKE